MNMSPNFLKKFPVRQDKAKDVLHVSVTHIIPAAIMGSGLGSQHCYRGDYDIQLFDKEHVKSALSKHYDLAISWRSWMQTTPLEGYTERVL